MGGGGGRPGGGGGLGGGRPGGGFGGDPGGGPGFGGRGPGPGGPVFGGWGRGPFWGGPFWGRGPRRRGFWYWGGGGLTIIIFAIIMMSLLFGGGSGGYRSEDYDSKSNDSVESTIVREKLDSGNAYINDCIIDELGWFDNRTKTEKELKEFWEQTGVQPYIILKSYDSSLTTNDEKEQWAKDYYDENFDTENIFLYVYFAEQDSENDVGYMAYANGYQTSSVMDSEAVEIFWNYIDKYWYSNETTDQVFIKAFNSTATAIMSGSDSDDSKSGGSVLKVIGKIIMVLAVIAVIIFVIALISRNRRKKEEEEVEEARKRILDEENNKD
jgi:hypothetical protein